MKQLVAKINADASGFNKAMDMIGVTAGGAAGIVVGAFIAATAAVVALEKAVIGTSSSFEDMESKLKIVLGSAKDGARIFKQIRDEAAKLPIDTKAGIEAFTTLLSLTDRDVATRQWKNLASIAESLGSNADVAAASVGTMMLKLKEGASGSLIARSMMKGETAKLFGEGGAGELIKMMRAGEDNNVVLKRMNEILEEQGKIAREELGKTFTGQMKTFMGALDIEKSALGKRPLETAKKILGEISKYMKGMDFNNLSSALDNFMQVIHAIVSSSGFKEFIQYMADIIPFIINAVTGLVGIFGILFQTLTPLLYLINKIKQAWEWFVDKGLDLVMPGSDQGAATKEEIEAFRNRPQKVEVVTKDGANAFA